MNRGVGYLEDDDEMPEMFQGSNYHTLAPTPGPRGQIGPQPQNWGITQAPNTWSGDSLQPGGVIVSNTSGVATTFSASELLAK